MKRKLLSVLLLSLLVLTGCNKSDSIEMPEISPTPEEVEIDVEPISCKEVLLSNYWSTISDPDYPDLKDYYNFNEDSIFALYSIGPSDLGLQSVDSMEDYGDSLIIDATHYTDDGGTLKVKYTITAQSEDVLDVAYYMEKDDVTAYMTLNKVSINTIIEERSPYYPDEEFFNSQMEFFESTYFHFADTTQSVYYSKEDAAQIVIDYFESMGVSGETHYVDVVDYEYNGRIGYSVTGSVDNAPYLFLYNIGEIFVDGETGEITILEHPPEDEGRGY